MMNKCNPEVKKKKTITELRNILLSLRVKGAGHECDYFAMSDALFELKFYRKLKEEDETTQTLAQVIERAINEYMSIDSDKEMARYQGQVGVYVATAVHAWQREKVTIIEAHLISELAGLKEKGTIVEAHLRSELAGLKEKVTITEAHLMSELARLKEKLNERAQTLRI